jgi:hypothetical protein
MNYKLLKDSATGMRIWLGKDEQLYLADHSGDSNDHKCIPTETDDGPLRLLPVEDLTAPLHNDLGRPLWTLPVYCEFTCEQSAVSVRHDVARWLARYLSVPLRIQFGRTIYRLEEECE